MSDDLSSVVTRIAEADERDGHPVARSQWAPAGCTCPWPWPLDGGHIRLTCPHYVATPSVPIAPFLDGCHQTDGTWIHGRRDGVHTCPAWVRGTSR